MQLKTLFYKKNDRAKNNMNSMKISPHNRMAFFHKYPINKYCHIATFLPRFGANGFSSVQQIFCYNRGE